jgi:hypothetical protein
MIRPSKEGAMNAIRWGLVALTVSACGSKAAGPAAFVKPGEAVITAPPGARIEPVAVAQEGPQLPADSPLAEVRAAEVAALLPQVPGARLLTAPENPGGALFFVRAVYCVDGATVEDVVASLVGATSNTGWVAVQPTPSESGRADVSASRGALLYSASASVGDRPGCNAEKGQVVVEMAIRKQR